jgi:hypothetical protein
MQIAAEYSKRRAELGILIEYGREQPLGTLCGSRWRSFSLRNSGERCRVTASAMIQSSLLLISIRAS